MNKGLRKYFKLTLFLFFFFSGCNSNPQAFFFFINNKEKKQKAIAAFIKPYEKQIDTSSQRIMLVGDSMVGVLRWKFRDYCQYNGHKLYVVLWDAANTYWYSRHDTLKYYIEKIKPTYIFIVLGANELFIPNIKKRRAKYVKHILEMIGDIPYVWVGPPNWKKDTGINDLLSKKAGIWNFFPSYKISLNNPKFKRYKDGAHPLPSSAQIWMDSLAIWVMKYAQHPIKFYKPPEKGNMNFKLYYLAPMLDSVKKQNDTINLENQSIK